jgi:outer membrane lipoprotein-sorting protein
VIPQDQRLLPAKSAEKEELFHDLEELSKQIQTLQGTVTLDVSGGGTKTGVLTEYRQTKGYLFVERPQNIRIKVLAPVILTTVADMVSDGKLYRVSIPVKNQWTEGDATAPVKSDSPIASLRPQHFLDGLFVDITPYLENRQVKYSFSEQVEGRRSFYVFTFIDVSSDGKEVRTLEKLWIDRNADLEVTRKQIYGQDGRIETDVEYSNYQKEGNVRFPQLVVIQRPIEDYTLKLTFQKTNINEKLPENVFVLQRPEGAEFVQIAQ